MSPRLRPHLRLLLAVVAAMFALPGNAFAVIQIAGSGEPNYTKGTNNTYWVTYSGGGGNSFYGYRLHTYFSKNGTIIGNFTTGNLGLSASGTTSGNFSAVAGATPLTEGSAYTMCVWDEYDINGGGSGYVSTSGLSSCTGTVGKSGTSTIDRSPPALAVAVNGADLYANNLALNVTMQYQDAVSPPWPNATAGLGANQICVLSDTNLADNPATLCNSKPFYYDAGCSTITGPLNNRQTTFGCTYNLPTTTPDGYVVLCAKSSDSAIPDNPNGSNQFVLSNNTTAVTSTDANVSGIQCGWVTLDRTAPSLQVAAPSSATVGQLVTVTGTGTDATSGLSGNWTWDFGDNTAGAVGASATHTYTQTGTFQVKGTSKDNAGNVSTATANVTVGSAPVVIPTPTPAPVTGTGTGGSTGTGTGGSTGTGTGGTTGTGTGTGGTTGTGGSTTGTGTGTTTTAPTTSTAGGTVTAPPTAAQIVAAAGGSTSSSNPTSNTLSASVGALDVLAPKQVTLGKKSFAVALTSTSPGKADLSLVKNGKIKSKGSVTLTAAGTIGFSLKLPKSLAAGTYDLQVVLTPTGGGKASTVKLKVKFAAAKKKSTKKAKASAARAVDSTVTTVVSADHPIGQPAPGINQALDQQ